MGAVLTLGRFLRRNLGAREGATFQTGRPAAVTGIVDGTDVLWVLTPGASVPNVQLLQPTAGQSFASDAVIPVRWEAGDADGDQLLYDVYYSADAGATFGLVAALVSDTGITLQAAAFAGTSDGSIKVVASDGSGL